VSKPPRRQLAQRLEIRTEDGLRLAAGHVPGSGGDPGLAVVVAHGFTGSMSKPATRAVVSAFADRCGVVAFDFRGHGRSGGRSTVGDVEVLDVEAAVQLARDLGYRDVVTCGWSMGGSVVLRHAALRGGVAAVVSVSAVSRWFYRETAPMRRVHWAIETRTGRMVSRRLLGTRITAAGWDAGGLPGSPVDLAGAISPIPLLIVHGARDHYFPVDQAEAIYAAARQPKELWLVDDFGHAENAATPQLLSRLVDHLPDLVASGRRGTSSSAAGSG
jgi:pimeloyl-ACP methyl ester carboxylesterase